MGFDDFATQGQTKAGPPLPLLIGLLRRVERLEDFAKFVGGDSAARIADRNLRDARFCIRADGKIQCAAILHGLPCVDDQIEQYLFELHPVALNERQPLREPRLEQDIVPAQLVLSEGDHLEDRFIDIQPPLARRLVFHEGPDPRDDRTGPPTVVDDAFERPQRLLHIRWFGR